MDADTEYPPDFVVGLRKARCHDSLQLAKVLDLPEGLVEGGRNGSKPLLERQAHHRLAAIHEAFLAAIHEAFLAAIHEAFLAAILEAFLAAIHEAFLAAILEALL